MENKLKKGKVFSDEIVEFSKLIDIIFEKIAKDIHAIKSIDKPKNYDDKILNLEKKHKKDIDALSSEIKSVKRLVNDFIVKTNKKITLVDRKAEENKRDVDNLKITIKKIEGKLKIKIDEL